MLKSDVRSRPIEIFGSHAFFDDIDKFVELKSFPSRRNLALEGVVPDHRAAAGFVGADVGVGEVELHEPVVVDRLRQRFQLGVDAIV